MKKNTAARSASPTTFRLTAVFTAYFTVFFILSTVNVALPRIAAELDGLSLYSWAVSIPALTSAFATLIFAKLSDMYGRRIILLASLGFIALGASLSALSQSFSMLIGAMAVTSIGQGAIQPLCFSVLGDMFEPAERSRWAGLLNIASGITAFIGPSLSGWFVDNQSWRFIFWAYVPLAVLTALVVWAAFPKLASRASHRLDVRGSILLAGATSSMIIGFSLAGSAFPWLSFPVTGLLAFSLLCWVLFLRAETGAAEPMLAPQLLRNRIFLTASLSALLSLFGLTAVMVYYPLFLQGVQQVSATAAGSILTPFNVLLSFMGIPAGFLLARSRRYRWMYIGGYAILTATMFVMVGLNAETPPVWTAAVSIMAGVGLGAIPTINAMVVQYAVPKRLLGAATGGLYFFVAMGRAIGPAILGSIMNAAFLRSLGPALPASLRGLASAELLGMLNDPRVLLSAPAMNDLELAFTGNPSLGMDLFHQTVRAVQGSLQSGLRAIFLFGAVTMLLSFLLILTIPGKPLQGGHEEPPASAVEPE